jgi:hypothetical protein
MRSDDDDVRDAENECGTRKPERSTNVGRAKLVERPPRLRVISIVAHHRTMVSGLVSYVARSATENAGSRRAVPRDERHLFH